MPPDTHCRELNVDDSGFHLGCSVADNALDCPQTLTTLLEK